MTSQPDRSTWQGITAGFVLAGVGALLVWTYWPALSVMARKWESDPQYSHGYLVIPFAVFLLWVRRKECPTPQPGARGLAVLAAGAVLRLAGAWCYFDWAEAVSLLVSLAGVVLLAGGGAMLRWAMPAIGFLLFMIPLPYRVEFALAGTLQQAATSSCAVVLHLLGRPAVAEGNVLIVGGRQIEVVAACSGLGSLLVFVGMAVAVGLLYRPPLLDRVLLVLSAVPVALGTNVLRITATVLLEESFGDRGSFEVFHEMAGWLMMAAALGLLRGELWLLRRVFVPISSPEGQPEPPPPRPSAPGRALSCRVVVPAVVVLLAHGLLHGWWVSRWSDAAEPQASAERLREVPEVVGEWEWDGQSLTIDPKRQSVGEITGYVLRNYVHRRRGTVVTLLIVCGRPGPIAVHTPDVCYRGAGYVLAAPEGRETPEYGTEGAVAEFRTGSFGFRDAAESRLKIYWSWNDGNGWRAPSYPRFRFGAAPALYKMYVVREATTGDDSVEDFLRSFLPALDQAVLRR